MSYYAETDHSRLLIVGLYQDFFVLIETTFFFFELLSVPIKGMDEMSVQLDDGTDFGEAFFLLATVCPD
jgi:hypothetical protein